MKSFKIILFFIKSILNIGINKGEEPHYQLLIRIINLILILGIITALINNVSRFLLTNDDFHEYFGAIVILLVCVFGLYLNHKKYYDGASAVATIGLTSLFVFNAYLYDISTARADLIFLPLSVTAPLTFRRRWLGIVVFIYISILLGVLIQNTGNPIHPSNLYIVFMVSGGMVLSTQSIIRHLGKSAEELKLKNRILLEQNRLQEELIRQNKLRQELLGVLCHDLKGPTTAFNKLSNKVSYLLKKERYNDLERLGDYFEQAGNKIFNDIDRLLNWTISQKENIITRNETFSLLELTHKITKSLLFQFDEKNVVFHNQIPDNLIINSDPHILEIILKNLLVNAAKYTENGVPVTITHKRQNNIDYAVIYNSGEAIDATIVEQAKAGQYRKSKYGHGLGLGICYSLIKFIGGAITFDTAKNTGTTVILEIPYK